MKLIVVKKYHLRKSVVRVSFSISAKRESEKSKQLWHLNAGSFRAPVKIGWASVEAPFVNIALKQPHFTVWKLLKAELGHCNSNGKAPSFHKYYIKPSMLSHKSNLIPQSSSKKNASSEILPVKTDIPYSLRGWGQ